MIPKIEKISNTTVQEEKIDPHMLQGRNQGFNKSFNAETALKPD